MALPLSAKSSSVETSQLFRGLSSSDLDELLQAAEEKQFATGECIFREGDVGDGVYFVRHGSVQISGVAGRTEREVFAHAKPGELFGEMAVLDDLPRSASATAEEDTTVCFIPREQMLRLLQNSPKLSFGLVQEISKRLRESNKHYVEKVLQAERMVLVGRFASSIVHDLKNPLSIIGMSAEAACQSRATPQERRAAANRINQQLERITSLVNDILEYTRGEETGQPFEQADYSKFILGVVSEIQPELALRSVRIEFANPPPALQLPLRPKRLSRVFHNLLGNAADAMPQGGRITLRFTVTETEVTTVIRDTGPGIAPEILDKIFEAFVTFGKPRGTGLGLSICQRIVEEHHGTLSACNDPPGGAVFTLRLPRAHE